jgi:hypothetical protein
MELMLMFQVAGLCLAIVQTAAIVVIACKIK